MITRVVLRALWITLLVGASLLWTPRILRAQVAAVTCSVTTNPTINFGVVNGLATGAATQATVAWTCSNPSLLAQAYATFCIHIGNGSGGVQGTNRLMAAGAGQNLQFQLYQDSANTAVWGSLFAGVNPTPYQVSFVVPLGITALLPGTYNGTATVYGVVPNAQIGLTSGSYTSSFVGINAQATVASNYAAAPATCGTGNASSFSFTVSATVNPSCAITAANNLNFGTPAGLLTANVDGTTTVQTQCTASTPFQIGLDNGQNAIGAVRRMRGGSGDLITYELYQDSGRATRWGNTVNSDTVSGTGNGAVQTTTVYGRVAAQATPTPDTYTDTITVSVTY